MLPVLGHLHFPQAHHETFHLAIVLVDFDVT